MNNLIGTFFVFISAIGYGLMPIFAYMAYSNGVSTITMLFLRFISSSIIMFIIVRIRKLSMPKKNDVFIFLLMGFIGYTGQSLCYFTALKYAAVSIVSLLLYTYPIMVMIFSIIILKEKIKARNVIALVIALIGVSVIISVKGNANIIGILLAVLTALIYSIYIIISTKVLKKGMEIQASGLIMVGSAIAYGLMNLFYGFTPPKNGNGIIAILLISIVSTVIAFWAFFAGLKRVGPSITSLVSIFEPVVTVVSSILILSEKVTKRSIIGGIFVITSLLIIMIPKKIFLKKIKEIA